MHDRGAGHPTDEQLRAFSLGAVATNDLEWIAAHVGTCWQCCAAIEDLAATDAMVARLIEAVAPENPGSADDLDRDSAVLALRRGRWREVMPIRACKLREPASSSSPVLDPTGTPAARQVGAYDILGEIGRGGMGVVYKARHRGLNRLVALKMVLAGEFASEPERRRFQREAELAARMKHVNIVQIHEVGQSGDRPYIAMEWVEGGTLADRLDGAPWPPRDAAKLIRTLAQAIDAAHRQGVIHRDLKPANILVQPDDEAEPTGKKGPSDAAPPLAGLVPKITDFGLARSLRDQASLTKTGLAVGTPEYMAPEQASGDPGLVGPAADVYALGVILYQLLTGQPPFRGESPAAVLRAAANDLPVAPGRIASLVPRDLETIALKAIEREPAERYRTAAALGEDLRRFLAHEPILARPPRLWERSAKWARRQPHLAALAASLVAVTGLALVGLTALWLAAARANIQARRNGQAERRALYRAGITAAASALQLNHTETARGLLDSSPIEHQNWEWRYLVSQLDNARTIFRPGKAPAHLVVVSPDCRRVLYANADESALHLHDVAADREIAVLSGHKGAILSLAWSGDGSRVASSSADRTVRLWDGSTGRPLAVLRGHAQPAVKIHFNNDASRLVTQTSEPVLRVWNAARGMMISTLSHVKDPRITRLSPDGKRFAVGRWEGVQLWDTDSGAELTPLHCEGGQPLTLAFSPDGARLAAGTDYPQDRVWLWDMATGRAFSSMERHTNTISGLEFSPDGRRIASASHDQTLRLWDGVTGQPVSTLRGHSDRVIGATFHPDGRRLVSASLDGTYRLWDAQDRELIGVFRGQNQMHDFAISKPSGSVLASVGSDGLVHFWDIERLKNEGVLGRHTSFVYDVAFSPSGSTAASAAWDGTVRLWDPRTGRSKGTFQHPNNIVTFVAFRPDGRQLISACRPNRVVTWDLETGRSTAHLELTGGDFTEQRIAFAPGSAVAASTGGRNGSVRLFASWGGGPDVDLPETSGRANDVAFSPDGSRLVSGHADGSVRIWDVGRRSLLGVLRGHKKSVFRVAYRADGYKIATASDDMTAQLWDATTFSNLAVLKHHGIVYTAAFSPDGSRLATGCSDNNVHLWDTETYDEVVQLRGHTSYVHSVAFSPDGTTLISGSGDFTVRIWDSRSPNERRGWSGGADESASPADKRDDDRESLR